MDEDPFETVAIAYTQPQVAVMLSMFGWYGIPAYAKNFGHIGVDCPVTLALGGFPVRVHREFAEEARGLLAEAADRCLEEPAKPQPLAYRIAKVPFFLLLAMGAAPPPRLSATLVRR